MAFSLKKLFSGQRDPAAEAENYARKHEAEYSFAYSAFKEKPRVEYMINYAYLDTEHDNVVVDSDFSFFRVYKFRGSDMASATPIELMSYTSQMNNALKALGGGYVIYLDAQRHTASDYEKSQMPNAVLQLMENEREQYYAGDDHYETDFYLVVYHNPPFETAAKIKALFMDEAKDNEDDRDSVYAKALTDFLKAAEIFTDMLGRDCFKMLEPLTAEETISYLHNIVSDHRMVVRPDPYRFINDYICDSPILGGHFPKIGNKYMRVISIKSFPAVTEPGFFNAFQGLDFEYRWVSRWICLSKHEAEEEIKKCQQLWNQQQISLVSYVKQAITNVPSSEMIDEHALSNSEDAASARAELNNELVSFGYYTMTMQVFDEDKKRCQEKANRVLEHINSLGFVATIETDNSLEAYRGSLPGCYRCNIRRPLVNSLNFCHLAPATATWSGDERNNDLQGPCLLYTDSSGYTPFRFNFHCDGVGHTMIIGPSGAGKSVLLNTIEAHFTKYPNSNVFIFDKSASSRALTLAAGGNFYNLAAEGNEELSFQPLAEIDDDNEVKWAKEWLASFVADKGITITANVENALWNGLKSLRAMPKHLRTISQFVVNVQHEEIRQSLHALTREGAFGKLFDNDKDFSGEGRWQVFEMETLMQTRSIVPATLDYLFHRIEKKIKSSKGPSIIVLDECWLFFDNPAFQDKLREYFKDMRKKNTSIIFATQNLADVASKPALFNVVSENCKSRIYLPNPTAMSEANAALYRQFGCNETQIDIIQHMTPKQDYYYTSPRGNRVFALALQPAELPFVTATAKSDQIMMDKILAEQGRDAFLREWFKYKKAEEEYLKLLAIS